jgi:glycosyltransferase involved in cell wall biosynthesis
MRVLLLIKSLGPGGAEHQCSLIATQLAKEGHSICIAVYDSGDTFYSSMLPSQVKFESFGLGRWNILGLIFALRRLIKSYKPDLVYSFLSHSNLISLVSCKSLNVKIVCGIRSSGYNFLVEPTLSRLGEWLHRKLLRFADSIITNSNAARVELGKAGIAERKIFSIENGIDTERFQFNADARDEIRRGLGFAINDRVIGLFARAHPMKGHSILLQAFSQALLIDPDLRLLLIGKGVQETIQSQVISLNLSDKIVFLNVTNDIERFYSAIDLYCSASLYGEGFPNTLSEAMSTGLPCIATDVGDSALIMAGLGHLIIANDVQQLSNAIHNCSTVQDAQQTEARRSHIINNYSLQRLGERTIQVLSLTLEK